MRNSGFAIGFLMFVVGVYVWTVVPHPLDAPVAAVLSWFGGVAAFSRKNWIGWLRSRLLGSSHAPDEVRHLDEALRHLFQSADEEIGEWGRDGHRRQAVHHIRCRHAEIRGGRKPMNPVDAPWSDSEEGDQSHQPG